MKSSIKKLLMLKAPNFVVTFSAASGRQYSIQAEGVEAVMQRDGIVYMHISRTTNLRCRTVRSGVLRYHWLSNPQGWLGNWSGLLQGTRHSRESSRCLAGKWSYILLPLTPDKRQAVSCVSKLRCSINLQKHRSSGISWTSELQSAV